MLIPRNAAATTFLSIDGNYWQAASNQEQIIAVQGTLSALQTGFEYGAFAMLMEHYGQTMPRSAFRVHQSSIKAVVWRYVVQNAPRFSHTFGIYANEISNFYNIHPKADRVVLGAVLWCLRDGENHQQCESNLK
jgi:hypothetical protein